MKNFIELQNITKRYSDQKIVLNDISLSIKKGEILSVVGPSGCGKSTLLRCIAGLEDHEGTIKMENTERSAHGTEQRTIVLMFQDSLLFPHMNVLENVTYGLKMKKIPKKARIRCALEMLEKVEMEDHLKKFPYELSGGQQQRVALARALVTKPDLLLLDEPFSSLDQSLRLELRQYVRNVLLEEGVTALFITHDIEEASFMGNRLAVMGKGSIQQIGDPINLSLKPVNSFVARFFSDGLLVENGFIPTRALSVKPSITGKSEFQLEGVVKNSSLEYGQTIYHIYIPKINQMISLPSTNYHFSKGDPILLNYTEESIHYFNELTTEGGEKDNENLA
ncbi:ABC transporter ATP-binding protein [Pseudalkalibacillus sp. SCS-8]|uniref:ABC transporter ATP-binding protein n=1 Tax=Pseudalkalibacillus nanhaiensis TaxID=3115291 RepID=UPI0032DA292A